MVFVWLAAALSVASAQTVIQFLQYSDWHGSIADSPILGAHLHGDEAAYPEHTIILTAGDDFGATEPVSALNDDVPAVLVQNLFGTDAGALGNHNFDSGLAFLLAKVELADYPYASCNLENLAANLPGVVPYHLIAFPADNITVAMIGFTNEDADELVEPGSMGTLVITDAAAALTAARAAAEAEGANLFAAYGHMGVQLVDATTGEPSGPLIDLARNLTGFHLVFGDHTDVQYTGVINGATVAEAESRGGTYNRIAVTAEVDAGTGALTVVDTLVETITPNDSITEDAAIRAAIDPFYANVSQLYDGAIGQSGGYWERDGSYERVGEAELGNLFVDALLEIVPHADVAIVNGGGIRSPLSPATYVTAADATADRDEVFPDDVVLGDLFSLEPFSNIITTQSMTGAALMGWLEHGLATLPVADGVFPQVGGMRVVYDSSLAADTRLVSVTLDDGTVVANDESQTFTMASTEFLSKGGDGLPPTTHTTLGLVTDALAHLFAHEGLLTPYFDCRLVDENPEGVGALRTVNPLGDFASRDDCQGNPDVTSDGSDTTAVPANGSVPMSFAGLSVACLAVMAALLS